jgi:hypothetical protein
MQRSDGYYFDIEAESEEEAQEIAEDKIDNGEDMDVKNHIYGERFCCEVYELKEV